MTTDTKTIVTQAAAGALADILDHQPWWRAKANTVTAAATGIATMATWLATTELGFPDAVRIGAGLLAAAAGVLATRATRNGTTTRGSQAVLDGVVERVTDALTPRPGSIEDLIAKQSTAAAEAAGRAARDAATKAIAGAAPAVIVAGVIEDATTTAVGSAEAFLDMLKRGAR